DGDLIGELSAMNMKADAHRFIGDSDKARELYAQATQKLQGLENRSLEAAIMNNIGLIDHDEGAWEQARDEYVGSLAIYESILRQPVREACLPKAPEEKLPATKRSPCQGAAAALDNLGQVYCSLQQPEKGQKELQVSLEIRKALGATADQGVTLLHIGYADYLLEKSTEALAA